MIEITNEQKEQMASFWGSMITNETQEFVVKEKYDELFEENKRLNNIINELKDFLTSYKKHRNSFKWNEQDYIDTIEEIEKILEGSDKE